MNVQIGLSHFFKIELGSHHFMFHYLSGILKHKGPCDIILDVQGVGYGISIDLSTLANLPEAGQACTLWIYTKVREDSIHLYGFQTLTHRQAFEILIQINGVGPKVALAILSTLTLTSLQEAVKQKQSEILQHVPGIGKRTADKILLELQNKIDKLTIPLNETAHSTLFTQKKPLLEASEDDQTNKLQLYILDLKSALENLGFKEKELNPILQNIKKDYTGETFSELLQKALKTLGNKASFQKETVSKQAPTKSLDLNKLF